MRRRDFIALPGAAALALEPDGVRAQQPPIYTIDVLIPVPAGEPAVESFRDRLRDLGYAAGKTLRLDLRSAESDLNRLPELAVELVHEKVDVIATWTVPPALINQRTAKALSLAIPRQLLLRAERVIE